MLSVSILSIKENIRENIEKLSHCNIDYIHLDIMDGRFVQKKTWDFGEIKYLLNDIKIKKDVHLMVNNVKEYVNEYKTINPDYITFHFEVGNTMELIEYIKSFGIKVGLSINPHTHVRELLPYLPYIDLVLIMSVEPGLGGQTFIESSLEKIEFLNKIKKDYNYVIEVDGGINDKNIHSIHSDIDVVGSYITNSENYEQQIKNLRRKK